ncbi:apolipoprotein D and lipocalin family protein [Psychrobacter immobilis]|uniref:Apolipoprotein D and lipocalin family protein n=1 Tax=Psychrobacter immobilis TaxID=498 RepID=A0A2V2A4Q8_PSYIM|nr:lipocalin family protein [Psychrobacter immobilis]PWK14212.1 apolipoprotein D and lipocalin family protein [Psychrobacter immobilis]
MKTNKLPQSAWSDTKEAGSQSKQTTQSRHYHLNEDSTRQTGNASNDASYNHDNLNDQYSAHLAKKTSSQDHYFGYKSADKSPLRAKESAMINSNNNKDGDSKHRESSNFVSDYCTKDSGHCTNDYKWSQELSEKESGQNHHSTHNADSSSTSTYSSYKEIPERIFMNGLIKHTGIALAIIIPLAAFSAYAATPLVTATADMTANATTETLSIKPSAIIHKSASTPTTVDSVDLKRYAGTWYEIGRLPMYFQRNCASDVTANYTEKTDGSGIIVTNKCVQKDGSGITSEGIAKPVDESGSKLKVTFLPSWIRWLPVGRADYWVLARDADYKTALVGTPDKKYLWLLARSPNVTQETYAKYRQIAQQQGYDLKEFKLTPQTNQTVSLVP